jgi:hypothetical protein
MLDDLYLVVNDGYLSEMQTTLKVCLPSHTVVPLELVHRQLSLMA